MNIRTAPVGLTLARSRVAALLAFIWVPTALSGGFTQSKGGIFSDLTFRTVDSGSFSKLELQAYVEYGLLESLTFIIKSPYNWLENKVGKHTTRNEGFIDQEVGLRRP